MKYFVRKSISIMCNFYNVIDSFCKFYDNTI